MTDSRSRLTAAGRFLLFAGVVMVLLLGFNAAGLSVRGSTHVSAATQSISTTQVQWDLAGLGYLPWSGIDGVYGPQTTAAVKTFQSNVCIAVDGVAGPQTDASLSSVVQAVQAKVGATQDGLFGPQTKAGVEAYQQAHGLTVDGQAGPVTMGAMGITRVHSCGSSAPPPAAAPRTPTPAPRAPATPAPAPAPTAAAAPTQAPHTGAPPGHGGAPPANGGTQPGAGGSTGDPGTGGNPTTRAVPAPTPRSTPASPAPTQTCVPLLLPTLAVAPGLQPCIAVAGPGQQGPGGITTATTGGSTNAPGEGNGQAGSGQKSGSAGSGSRSTSSGDLGPGDRGTSAPASGGEGGTGSAAATATPGSSGSPQATAEKDLSLVASSGDGLAWPGVLGGLALFGGLALLLLARRAPGGTRGRRR